MAHRYPSVLTSGRRRLKGHNSVATRPCVREGEPRAADILLSPPSMGGGPELSASVEEREDWTSGHRLKAGPRATFDHIPFVA
jgi:hypothetical protein